MKQLQPKRFATFAAALDYINDPELNFDNTVVFIIHEYLIINSFKVNKIREYKDFASNFIMTRECTVDHHLSKGIISIEVFNR